MGGGVGKRGVSGAEFVEAGAEEGGGFWGRGEEGVEGVGVGVWVGVGVVVVVRGVGGRG